MLEGIVGIGVLAILVILGVHWGLSLGLVGFLGLVVVAGSWETGLGVLLTTPYHSAADFTLTVLPLFVLMGMFTLHGGISEQAFESVQKWIGRLPGSLALATVWGCVAFGAASGSALAAASVFTKVSLPQMRDVGYDKRFSCGVIASAAIISVIIPPSILFVIYGVLVEVSIGTLFIAGILPGLLLAILLTAGTLVIAARNPSLAPAITTRVLWKERIIALGGLWPVALLIILVLGGIYSGVFTPTEAGATGAFGTFVIALARRRLSWDKLRTSLVETVEFTATLFFILVGALIFSRFLAISGFTSQLVEVVVGLGVSRMALIAILMVIYLILGCFMDAAVMMILTLPIIFPVIEGLGFNPIWFGVILLVVLEAGLLTPPFGLNLFVVKAAAGPDVSVGDVVRGSFPFLIMVLITLVFLIAFPQISLFLPGIMLGVK